MRIPRPLCAPERRTPDGQCQVPPYLAQRAGHEGEVDRLCPDTGQRGVHHAHSKAEHHDAEITRKGGEVRDADSQGQKDRDRSV